MKVVKSEQSGKWMYDAGKHLMEASCHHREDGACGGCYARAVEVLSTLASRSPEGTAAALLEELKREDGQ